MSNLFDISGDDDVAGEDEIGAIIRKRVAAGKPITAKTVTQAAQLASTLKSNMAGGSDRAREFPLPLDSVSTIGAGATGNVTAAPQKAFQPQRIVVGASIAASFLINSFFVGTESQFVSNAGSMPADVFAPNAVGVTLRGTAAGPGITISLSVTNTSAGALRFVGAIIGLTFD